jgi:hypothetical protein
MELKEIINHPGYFISDTGEVYRTTKNKKNPLKVMSQRVGHGGYKEILLSTEKKRYPYYVHRLVLEAFEGPCPRGMECRHLDGTKTNNNIENLTWGTPKENMEDRDRHGKTARGANHGNSNITEEDVRKIRELRDQGLTLRAIASQFNISYGGVGRICNRITWKHI